MQDSETRRDRGSEHGEHYSGLQKSCHAELAKHLVFSANVRDLELRSFVPQDDTSCEHRSNLGDHRARAFARLVADARQCRACPRMEGRVRLLGAANGSLHPRVCFIAEAPGRFGGDRTAVPLSGDQSGRNFDRLLAAAGLERTSIFVTNAVLCNPRDSAGRNAPPTTVEIRNCAGFLAETLRLLQPPYVVTLGAVALRALSLIEPHQATLAATVGDLIPWHDRWLVPLYHPSPRAQIWRSFEQQIVDFTRLGALLRQDDDARATPVTTDRSPERDFEPPQEGPGGRVAID